MNRHPLLAFAFVAILVVSLARADNVALDGDMTKASTAIGKLLHLRWSDSRIEIDREHWDESTGNKTEDEKLEEKIAGMVKRGIPEEIARRMVAQPGRRRGADFLTASPEGKLFEELKIAVGARSGGGGGGSDERHWDGRGNGIFTAMHVNQSLKDFRFTIREGKAPHQELIVEDHHVKGLRIQFNSPLRQIVFSQSPTGIVRVAHTSEKRNEAFQYATYDDMVTQEPAFAHDFGTLLQQLGINKPLTKHDSRVVNTVGRLLLKPDAASQKAAEAAFAQLGSESYPVREAAQKVIDENFVAWSNLIRDKLTDSKLDTEIRMRLQTVLKSSDFDAAEAERFIEQRKLLDDVDYLSSIVEQCPEALRSAVIDRIAELESAEKR